MNGGTLTFYMTSSPSKKMITDDSLLPYSKIEDNPIIVTPYSSRSKVSFDKEFDLELKVSDMSENIYFSLNGEKEFRHYQKPIRIKNSSIILKRKIWY